MLLQLSWLAEEAVCDNLQSTFINFRMTFQPWAMCSTVLGTEMSICNFSSGSAAWRGAASASDCPGWIKFWVWLHSFFFFCPVVPDSRNFPGKTFCEWGEQDVLHSRGSAASGHEKVVLKVTENHKEWRKQSLFIVMNQQNCQYYYNLRS